MRKWWIYIMLLLLLPLACVRELEKVHPETESEAEPEGKVTLTFTVSGVPVTPATKALGDDALKDMYVAVFGRSKFLKEYVKATDVVKVADTPYPILNAQGEPVLDDENQPVTVLASTYTFKVALSMTDNERTLHFLGNGPQFLSYGSATSTLPYVVSDESKCDGQAYWQMMKVDHIGALKNEAGDGYVISPDGDGKTFEPDAETKEALKVIPMIRNYAKIILSAENKSISHFVPKSFALYNVPKHGTIVPFNVATGDFIEEYQTKDYLKLRELGYPGNFVMEDDLFDDSIPDKSEFEDPEAAAAAGNRVKFITSDGTGTAFMFERSIPTKLAPETAIIVYGEFFDEEGNSKGPYFYRIDMMEKVTDNNKEVFKYYPVYRSLQYQVKISEIHSIGHTTPRSAVFSAGSADVSTSVSTQHLTDISDGHSRLIIKPWLAHTFTKQLKNKSDFAELQALYYENISEGYDETANAVTIELLPTDNIEGSPDIIKDPEIDATPGEYMNGYRVIRFTTVAPQRVSHSQTIRVYAGTLHRDVVITLQNPQEMRLDCSPRLVTKEDKKITLSISIPDGLAESMFPLQFIIEPENMTLTPDVTAFNNNLPVTSGESIKPVEEGVKKKRAFHFTRTITLEDYKNLTVTEKDGSRWRTDECHFVPTQDDNATTIWVNEANGFFVENSTSFKNLSHFTDLRFTDQNDEYSIAIPRQGDAYVHFKVVQNPDWPVIRMETTGMVPIGAQYTEVAEGVYEFQPDEEIVFIHFQTNSADGNISLKLSADAYEDKLLLPKRFTSVCFVEGKNVVSRHVNLAGGKELRVGYCDDPDDYTNPNDFASITIQGLTNNELVPTSPNSFPWRPDKRLNKGDGPSYHEVVFNTNGSYSGDINLVISAPGYVDEPVPCEGRFRGDIICYKDQTSINKSNILKEENDPYNFTVEHPEFDFKVQSDDKWTNCHISFNRITKLNNAGLWLSPGTTDEPYVMKIDIVAPENSQYGLDKLFYVCITFVKDHLPDFSRTESGSEEYDDTFVECGSFELYQGNSSNQGIWTLPSVHPNSTPEAPQYLHSGTLKIYPGEESVIIEKIVIRPYRGMFIDYP